MLPPDHRRLAGRVVEGVLDGAVLVDGHEVTVRLDGDGEELSDLVRERRTFQRKEPLRFVRFGSVP